MILPYPFPLESFPKARGLEQLRSAAAAFGFPYIFVAALDRVRGWAVGETTPFFDQPTHELLHLYTTDPNELESAWVNTLSSLASAWMADLQWRWKSHGNWAPGEQELTQEFLDALRADEDRPSP